MAQARSKHGAEQQPIRYVSTTKMTDGFSQVTLHPGKARSLS